MLKDIFVSNIPYYKGVRLGLGLGLILTSLFVICLRNLPHVNSNSTTTMFSIDNRSRFHSYPRKASVPSKEPVNKMDQFKERISNMTTRDLVKQGMLLLEDFSDPFTKGGMTIGEQGLLATIESNSSSVFEWGMGSSTVLAASMGVKRLNSIDSVKEWVSDCAKIIGKNNIVKTPDSYELGWANIGPIGDYGWPKDELYRDIWPVYPSAVQTKKEPYDVYLVDGRFRVACALQALLHGHKSSLVLMHDFNRQEYHVILDVADMLHKENNLAVLARKSNVKDEEILSMYEIYQYIPDKGRDKKNPLRKVSSAEIASRAPLQQEGVIRIPIPQI